MIDLLLANGGGGFTGFMSAIWVNLLVGAVCFLAGGIMGPWLLKKIKT